MVLVIDTSSAMSAVAVIDGAGAVIAESVAPSGPTYDIDARVRQLVEPRLVTRVAVATGPGSFTGLRVGASYVVGLALGLRLPLHRLRSLELAAARATEPATGVTEAGRGRVYYLVPGGEPLLGEPHDIPTQFRATGWLREKTVQALTASGIEMIPDAELRTLGEAAARLLGEAPEVGYDGLGLEYVQSFGPLAG